MTVSIFEQVNNKRKQWTPITPIREETIYPQYEGAKDTLNRALALKNLELPVKAFIEEGLSRLESDIIGLDGIETLKRNTLDEEKHDIALNNCTSVFPEYNPKYDLEANVIKKAWEEHPDFPITKTAVLENGIFFVILPLYRQYGTPSLRTTAFDISADEVGHVQSHRYAAKLSGHAPSPSLDKLRKATVDWLVSTLNIPASGVNKDTFMRISDELMYKGITPHLENTKSYQVMAFFEKSNDVLPRYA